MAGTASKALRRKREAVPVPAYTHDEVEKALAEESRTNNAYLSLSRHLRKHRPCRSEEHEPESGGILHRLWRHGHLSRRQIEAWRLFWRDLQRSYGESATLTTSYQERVCTSTAGVARADIAIDEPITARMLANIQMADWNAEHTSVQEKWSALSSRERGLVEQLIRDQIRITTGLQIRCHDLAYIGAFLTGFKDNRQALSAGASKIQDTLDHLADLYMVCGQ